MPRFVFLYTDAVIWAIVLALVLYAHHAAKTPELAAKWKKLTGNTTALFCAGLLSVFFCRGLSGLRAFQTALGCGAYGRCCLCTENGVGFGLLCGKAHCRHRTQLLGTFCAL